MGRDALSAVILAKAGIQRVNRAKRKLTVCPVLVEGFVNLVGRVLNAPQIGQLAQHQLFGEKVVSYGHRPINGHLSTLRTFGAVAHIEWVFREKAANSSD